MAKRRVRALFGAALIMGALTACGGGGGPAATPPAPSATTTTTQTGFSVGGSAAGLKSNRPIVLSLGDQQLSVQEDGSFIFPDKLEENTDYEVLIAAEPPRFDCEISNNSGTIAEQDVDDIEIHCETNDSFDLFSLDRLHSIKLTMTVDEWRAFELDTIRANSPLNHVYEEIAATGAGFELDEEQVMHVSSQSLLWHFSFSPCSGET